MLKWPIKKNGKLSNGSADFHCFGDLAVWLILWFHKARLPKHWILNGASNKKRRSENAQDILSSSLLRRQELILRLFFFFCCKFKSAPSIKPNATHPKRKEMCMWWKFFFFQLLRAFFSLFVESIFLGKSVRIKSKNRFSLYIFFIPYYLLPLPYQRYARILTYTDNIFICLLF